MNNKNLPKEYKGGFWSNIKRFFTSLFGKKEENVEPMQSFDESIATDNMNDFKPSNTISELREDNQRTKNRIQILNQVREHPELLETASIQTLEEVNTMLNEQIIENSRKIDYLIDEAKKLEAKQA